MENRPPYEVLGLTGEEVNGYVSLEPKVISVIKQEDQRPRIIFTKGQIDERTA